jgi:hypothetical protein
MKGMKKESASRREFIKRAAQVAAASTLVGCAGPATETSKQPDVKRRSARTKPKPGDHVPHPQGSKFKGKVKLPGFLPDTFVDDGQYLFLEEAILTSPGFKAFAAPATGGAAFQEPAPGDPATAWTDFNSWILGAPFNPTIDPATHKPVPFDALLQDIATRIRKYNAALYWMRRLHFHEKAQLLNIPINSAPPRNPHGDLAPDPINPTAPNFGSLVQAAQQNWKDAVNGLNDILLNGNNDFEYIWGDLVQVNNYIISMRIAASNVLPTLKSGAKIYEVGGSSSSHTSISSAFSSP